MQVQFGNRVIDIINVDDPTAPREIVENILGSPGIKNLVSILENQCVEIVREIRTNIENGNLNKASELNGYLKAFEDTTDFLTKDAKEALKIES